MLIELRKYTVPLGKAVVSLVLNSVSKVLEIVVTINKKPIVNTSTNDKARLIKYFSQPFLGLAFTDHIKLIEPCISVKIPVAPMNKMMAPMTVPMVVL